MIFVAGDGPWVSVYLAYEGGHMDMGHYAPGYGLDSLRLQPDWIPQGRAVGWAPVFLICP